MIKYMHVERLGTDEVRGILDGQVTVMPKLDGANGQIYRAVTPLYDELECASRNVVLSKGNTNQGFWNHVFETDWIHRYTEYFTHHPHHILYGEWLVPHTLKAYVDTAWKKFYVFDVFDSYSGLWLSYTKYVPYLRDCGISFVPELATLYNPKEVDMDKFLTQNEFLMQPGCYGEGIVIKRYDFVNKYGHVCWAKLVRDEFKEEFKVVMGDSPTALLIEERIARKFVTEGRISKILANMLQDEGWTKSRIAQLLGTVWHDVVIEETWNILKEYKNPTIDFRRLNNEVIKMVKELRPELFN